MRNLLRAFFLGLLFMSVSFLVSGQTGRKDIVYLKNGSIIKGTILEVVPNQSIKIQTFDGSIFVYKMEEVDKTAKEEVKKPEPIVVHHTKEKDRTVLPSGYFIMAKIGPKINPSETGETIDAAISLINGFHLNKYFSLGLGVEASGYTFGEDGNSSIAIVPVFLDARIHIARGKVNPMFIVQLGYSFTGARTLGETYDYDDEFVPADGKGGMYMAAGAGFRIVFSKRLSLLADGGIALQTLTGNRYTSDYDSDIDTEIITLTPATSNIPFLRASVGVCLSLGNKKPE
jgi:hypothetical protein